LTSGSRSRLLRYDVRSGQLQRQYVYDNAPVVKPPSPAGAFTVSGLVELLPFDRLRLLSMERSFSVGAGNSIKLYDVSLDGATDVGTVDDLQAVPGLRPVRKRLAFDLATLGLTLDNLEGMTLGPRLRGGKRALVIASDNNFMPGQVSQFLLCAAVSPAAETGSRRQVRRLRAQVRVDSTGFPDVAINGRASGPPSH
jgi:hypothetical protein